MKPKLVFLYGPPAAGKTTFAKEFVIHNPSFVRVSADEVRKDLYGSEDIYGDAYLIFTKILSKMRTLLKAGYDVIYDATNLRKSYREDYLNALTDVDCFKYIYKIHCNKETCIKRHIARARRIPLKDLLPLFAIDEPPCREEGWDKIIDIFSLD